MPSRKPVKPLKEPTASEAAGHTNTLLEEIRAEFKVFGDVLEYVREKVDSTFDQTGRNFEAIGRNSEAIERVDTRLKIVEKDVKDIKTQLQTFDHRLATVEAK